MMLEELYQQYLVFPHGVVRGHNWDDPKTVSFAILEGAVRKSGSK